MNRLMIYVHGQGGSAEEAEQMEFLDAWIKKVMEE